MRNDPVKCRREKEEPGAFGRANSREKQLLRFRASDKKAVGCDPRYLKRALFRKRASPGARASRRGNTGVFTRRVISIRGRKRASETVRSHKAGGVLRAPIEFPLLRASGERRGREESERSARPRRTLRESLHFPVEDYNALDRQ